MAEAGSIYRFADFELDCRSWELRKRGRRLRAQQQPLQILLMLVAAHGDVVTRKELRERVWGEGTHIDFDRAINKSINQLRRLLGDDPARPRFIETLPKRGYRFVTDVAALPSRREIRDDAREAYLKATYFWNKRTPDDLERSIDYFHRTIERDADYAPAWSGLANAHVMIGIFGLKPSTDVFPPAKAAAERALALDSSLAEAYTVLAEIQKLWEWNWEGAERSYQHAIALNPEYASAHHWYAQLLSILGRHDEARGELEEARRCDPLSPAIAMFFSYAAFEARDYEAAVQTAHAALELDRNAPLTYFMLGRGYMKLGDYQQAIAALEHARGLGGWFAMVDANLGYAFARAGDRSRAEHILADLRRQRLTRYISPIDIAQVCLGLRDTDSAIAEAEEACRTRAVRSIVLGDPFFAELHADPRYRALMARLRLPVQPDRGGS